MIKFFRKIRQELILDEKPKKYFRYAFGEIILVVLGILIALAINNWNSDRLLRKSAYQNMRALNSNIEDDLHQLQNSISFMDSVIMYSDRLNSTFQKKSRLMRKPFFIYLNSFLREILQLTQIPLKQ